MRRSRHILAAGALLLVVLAVVVACPGCRKPPPTPRVVINGRGWYVDLARTPQEQHRGLGGRTYLSSDVGMLFIFDQPKELTFCMRDTEIPLDIAFISQDLKVVSVQTMAVEPDRAGRAIYRSAGPAKYAMEVPAGGLTGAGAKPGDRVEFVDIAR